MLARAIISRRQRMWRSFVHKDFNLAEFEYDTFRHSMAILTPTYPPDQ